MPVIQLQTPNGYNYAIHSSNPDLIASWFAETMTREGPKFLDGHEFFLRLWPLYLPTPDGRGKPDWCVNATHGDCHDLRIPGSLDGLIAALTELRDKGSCS